MRRPVNRLAVRTLITLGTVVSVLAILAVWVERQALDTDQWVETSTELIVDEEIGSALQAYLVDELFATVDVQEELSGRLPPEAQPLVGPATGAIQQLAGEVAERILGSPRVQATWAQANRTAHELLLDLVEGEGDLVEAQGGVVALDLQVLVAELASRLGISEEVAERLPEDAARLEIIESEQLELAQAVAAAIRGLALALSLLALGCFGLAIFLGRDRRQLVVLYSGVGLIVAGLAVYALRHAGGSIAVEELVRNEAARPAAEQAWLISTSLMTSIATTVVVFGALFVVGSWLASPRPSALAARGALAPTLRDRPGRLHGLIAAVAFVYFVLAPTHGLRAMLTVAALALFAVIGLVALRRQAAREFPDAEPRDVGEGVRGWLADRREGARTGREARRPQPSAEDGRLDRLERLAALHERGLLSDDELEREKARILDGS